MGLLIKNVITLVPLRELIEILQEKNFFSEKEALLIKEAYKLFTEIQQITRLIIPEKITLDKNLDRYDSIFKKYLLFPSSESIFEKINYYSKHIDCIFNEKLK